MPLPASLFLETRGRSASLLDAMMMEEQQHHHQQQQDNSASMMHTMNDIHHDDDNGAPLCTPPITMTGFGDYGSSFHNTLGEAFSTSSSSLSTGSSLSSSAFSRDGNNSSSMVTGISNTRPFQSSSSSSSYPSNPRAHLLRRSSSSSTLGSIETGDEDDDLPSSSSPSKQSSILQQAWTSEDLERLQTIYEACVEEASFETPFSGPPPSQLLHAIAKACKKVYKLNWNHSITQTRTKTLQLAREVERRELNGETPLRSWADFEENGTGLGLGGGYGAAGIGLSLMARRASVEATPKPPGALGQGNDVEDTPRRRLRRNDSMDFLPHTWDPTAVARLSNRLNESGDAVNPLHYRIRTDTISSGSDSNSSQHHQAPPHSAPIHGRLIRSMTFSALNHLNHHDEDAHLHHLSLDDTENKHSDARDDNIAFTLGGLGEQQSYFDAFNKGPMSARPALGPGFGFLQAQQQQNQQSLHHAPSTSSLYSEMQESVYTIPSLNGSMDTLALGQSVDEDLAAASSNQAIRSNQSGLGLDDSTVVSDDQNMSLYGSSFASSVLSNRTNSSSGSNRTTTTTSESSSSFDRIGAGSLTPGSKKRNFDTANLDGELRTVPGFSKPRQLSGGDPTGGGLNVPGSNASAFWSATSLSLTSTASAADSTPGTPCPVNGLGSAFDGDYFSSAFQSSSSSVSFSKTNQLEQVESHDHPFVAPRRGSVALITASGVRGGSGGDSSTPIPTKPPLHKSYTFDAISTSPNKHMRTEESWFNAPRLATAGSGLWLESPFEEGFGHDAKR